MFSLTNNVPHDSNTTWTLLMDVFEKARQTLRGKLPPKIHIQMDNTWSDNKSRLSIALALRLVESGLFEEVEFGFLPVGHTHCDIDQRFSIIANYLKYHVADTFDALAAACLNCRSLVDNPKQRTLPDSNLQIYAEAIAFSVPIIDFRNWLRFEMFSSALLENFTSQHAINISNITMVYC